MTSLAMAVAVAWVPVAWVPVAWVPVAMTVAVAVLVDRHQLALRVHAVTDENPDLLSLVERGHELVRAPHGRHFVLHLTCRGGRCDPWEREHCRGPDSNKRGNVLALHPALPFQDEARAFRAPQYPPG
jgi:hypothetical protein